MGITRRLDELVYECKQRGIVIPETDKKMRRRDYVKLLGDETLRNMYPEGNVPEHLNFVRSLESVMLAARYTEQKPELKDELWKDSNDWIFSEKINGARILISYSSNEGIHMYSRNTSVETYLPIDYQQNIWLPDFDPSKLIGLGITSFIVDGEILSPVSKLNTSLYDNNGTPIETSLGVTDSILGMLPDKAIAIQKSENLKVNFHLFHILSLNEVSYLECPMENMFPILAILIEKLKECGLPCLEVKSALVNKKEFYKSIVDRGGEGVVAKNLKECYRPTESRGRGWIKIKRLVSEQLLGGGNGDTLEAWVSGFTPGSVGTNREGKVGSLEFSVYIRKGRDFVEHQIGQISGLSDVEIDAMSEVNFLGEPTLKEIYFNRVAEIDGQCLTAKNLRLQHCRMIRWRPDRSKDTCILDEATIKAMVLE